MNGEMVARNIQLILAPAVMITACVILLGAMHNRYAAINDRLRLMMRERLELLRAVGALPSAEGVRGAISTAPSQKDAYSVERLIEINAQVPDLLHRHKLAHAAAYTTCCAALVFVVDMFVIAVAVVAGSVWSATGSLIVFLAGAAVFFSGVLFTALEVRTSQRALYYEVDRVMNLAKNKDETVG